MCVWVGSFPGRGGKSWGAILSALYRQDLVPPQYLPRPRPQDNEPALTGSMGKVKPPEISRRAQHHPDVAAHEPECIRMATMTEDLRQTLHKHKHNPCVTEEVECMVEDYVERRQAGHKPLGEMLSVVSLKTIKQVDRGGELQARIQHMPYLVDPRATGMVAVPTEDMPQLQQADRHLLIDAVPTFKMLLDPNILMMRVGFLQQRDGQWKELWARREKVGGWPAVDIGLPGLGKACFITIITALLFRLALLKPIAGGGYAAYHGIGAVSSKVGTEIRLYKWGLVPPSRAEEKRWQQYDVAKRTKK